MTAGPLRRVAAAIGLVVLLPITSMLIQGDVTPEAAAQRALVVGLVVVVLGNVARVVVSALLARIERRERDGSAVRSPEEVFSNR